jgi:hypothetical protein
LVDGPPQTFIVTNASDSGPGSLRQASLDANNHWHPLADTVVFALDGPGPHTIAFLSQLPDITEPLNIDGYSQPGSSANTLAAITR